MLKTVQYELWKTCEHKCKFCYNALLKNMPDTDKVLLKAYEDIKTRQDVNIYSFIGGELFGSQYNKHKDAFNQMIRYLNEQMIYNENIKKVYFTCSLMSELEHNNLVSELSFFDNKNLEKITILTSYDTIGRFKNLPEEREWFLNLQSLKLGYPTININCSIILTEDFMKRYLNGAFKFEHLTNQNNVDSFFLKLPQLPYGINDKAELKLPDFFCKRETFIQFLKKLQKDNSELWGSLFNIEKRADEFIMQLPNGEIITQYRDKSTKLEYMSEYDLILPCGHQSVYIPFIDSNDCAMCIKQLMEEQNED